MKSLRSNDCCTRWHNVLLALILLVAFSLRVINIRWDEGKLTHPDERSTVAFYAPTMHWPRDWSTAWDPKQSSFNPLWDRQAGHRRSYTYGHFPLYLLTISADVASRTAPLLEKLGASAETVNFTRMLKGVPGYAYVGRFLMAVADTFTVYLVYLITRRLYGKNAGLLGALFSTFTVLQIQLAHFFAVDPISATFTLLAIYGSMLMVEKRSAGAAISTGVGCALAIASKFSALPILAAPVVATLVVLFRDRRTNLQDDSGSDQGWPGAQIVSASGKWRRPVGYLVLCLVVSFVLFAVTSPFVFLDWENWSRAVLVEQGAMVRGEADFPFTRQYRGTLPYIYFFEQQLKWGMGWALGVLGLGGLTWVIVRAAARRAKPGEWIVLSWIVPYFGLTGLFLAKFMRYMSPVVPLLVVFGVGLLSSFDNWLRERWDSEKSSPALQRLADVAGPAIATLVTLFTVFWCMAFVNGVYGHTHPWITASRWIYANVPDGSVFASEHWDDDLPLGLPEPRADWGSHGFQLVDLPLYEDDNEGKYAILRASLQKADYIVLASNRLYGSIPRLPERYPMSTRYYELLFAEELGFERVAEFSTFPTLVGITIPDNEADESFTVYDHPFPIVFEKTRQLDNAEWDSLLGGTWEGAVPGYVGDPILLERIWPSSTRSSRPERKPSEERQPDALLLDVPVDQLPVVHDFRWNRWASRSTVGGILVWWLALSMIGLAAWPLTFVLFRNLRGRGYLFARALGWLVVGYVNWLLASLRWMKNSLPSILVGLALLALLSLWMWRRHRDEMIAYWRTRWRFVLFCEAIFGLAFLAFVGIRIANPDLWQPWQGGEKFMEFAFLNAITRSPYFPPYDPYFAGGYLNYYYYGQYLVAVLIKFTGIHASVAFNLAIATLFALTVSGACTVVYNLLGSRGDDRDGRRSDWRLQLASGLLGSLFVAALGNLDGAAVLLRDLGEVSGSSFQSRLPAVQLVVRATQGLRRVVFSGISLPAYNYWEPSRVIPATINEFPYWSFLFADLHPHMIGIPFAVLFVGLALNMLRVGSSRRKGYGLVEGALSFLTMPFVLGALGVINTWDLPGYLGLGVLVFLVLEWRNRGRIRWWALIAFALALGGLSLLMYLPFFRSYEAVGASGIGLAKVKTDLGEWLHIWGFFIFIAFSYLVVRLVRRRGQSSPLRCLRLSLRRWEAAPRLTHLYNLLVEQSASHRTALLLSGLFFVATIALIAAKLTVPATLLIPLAISGLLLARREDSAQNQFITALIFAGLLILMGVEFVFLKDFLQGGDHRRMNTLFKFYIQVWVLLGLGTAAAIPHMWSRMKTWRSRWAGRVWVAVFAVLLLSSLAFVGLGTVDRVRDRFPGERPLLGTLDGMAFMTVGSYTWPDSSNRIELVYDYDAINWLLENVRGTPVVAEARLDYYREGGMRVSSFTGLPTLLGAHQSEQRYGDIQVGPRDQVAREFYLTGNITRAEQIIDELRIAYVYVGNLERTVYPVEGIAKFDEMVEQGKLSVVYRNQEVTIFQVSS